MTITKNLFIVFLLGCGLLWGCVDVYEQEKYQRPEWLAGKIYTQITTRPDLTVFKTCLELNECYDYYFHLGLAQYFSFLVDESLASFKKAGEFASITFPSSEKAGHSSALKMVQGGWRLTG